LLVLFAAALACGTLSAPLALGEVLFEDEFGTFDASNWEVFECLVHGQSHMHGGVSHLAQAPGAEGILRLEHHTCHELSCSRGTRCQGAEIRAIGQGGEPHTFAPSAPDREIVLETRTRLCDQGHPGVVGGIFLYMDNAYQQNPLKTESDEIDIELLTSQVVNEDHQGHHVVTASYDDFRGAWYDGTTHWFAFNHGGGLDLSEFNTYRVRWRAEFVQWFWVPDAGDDPVLLAETPTPDNAVPNEPMKLHCNIWAPDEWWPPAWFPTMEPTSDPGQDKVCYLDLDYVRVEEVPEPATAAIALLGGLVLTAIARRFHGNRG
jgi:hypothetical protein